MKIDSTKVIRRVCSSIHGGESSGGSHVSEPPASLQLNSWAAVCSRQPGIPAWTEAQRTQQPRGKEVGESETEASAWLQRHIWQILSNWRDISPSSQLDIPETIFKMCVVH